MADARLTKIISEYSETLDRLTFNECEAMGYSEGQCMVLTQALGAGPEGQVTDAEVHQLALAGFSKNFIANLANQTQDKALQHRVRWLGDHAVTRWWRPDLNDQERQHSIQELRFFGDQASIALDPLIENLGDSNADIQIEAIQALTTLGPKAEAAIPRLMELLKQPNKEIRSYAAKALAKIGTEQRIQYWIRLMQDNNPLLREGAVMVVGNFFEQALPALPALITALRDPAEAVQLEALNALPGLGPLASPAFPALLQLLYENPGHDQLRQSVFVAITFIGKEKLIETLIPKLHSSDALKRQAAAEQIRFFGTHGWQAIPDLIGMFDDSDLEVRQSATEALVVMGDSVVPELIKALNHLSPLVRMQAAMTLGVMGDDAISAVPDLIKKLDDPSAEVREQGAACALAWIGARAVPAIIQALNHPNPRISAGALQALHHFKAMEQGSRSCP